jgi:hypothetical protein
VGVSENIIAASWKALLDSIEYKLLKERLPRRGSGRRSKARGGAGGRRSGARKRKK